MVLFAFMLILNLISKVLTFCYHWNGQKVLPPCGLYQDTFGKWIDIHNRHRGIDWSKHFLFSHPGECLIWKQLWLPTNCSYHRFTNESLYHFVRRKIESNPGQFPDGVMHVAIFADSGTRDAVCGVTHLFGGSEIFGPMSNIICGNRTMHAVSGRSPQLNVTAQFFPNFKITFVYTLAGVADPWLLSTMEELMTEQRPYAVIYNTGIGHFIGLKRIHHAGDSVCDTAEADERVEILMKPQNLVPYKHLLKLAVRTKTRIIYRNNHYNSGYGALCFDPVLEEKLSQFNHEFKQDLHDHRGWEIWDNRRISRLVWRNSTFDGFHYGREHHAWTRSEHIEMYRNNDNYDDLGMLEMQLAQSMLHNLFYEEIEKQFFLNKRPFQVNEVFCTNATSPQTLAILSFASNDSEIINANPTGL